MQTSRVMDGMQTYPSVSPRTFLHLCIYLDKSFEYNENLIVSPGLEKLQEWYLTKPCNAPTSCTDGHRQWNAGSNNFKSDIRRYKNVNVPKFLLHTKYTATAQLVTMAINNRNNPPSCLWISRVPSYIAARVNIAVSVGKR